MPAVRQSFLAERDADEIWHYIARRSPANADRLIRDMDRLLNLLASNPMLGRKRDDVSPGMRSFPFRNYVIYYRPYTDGILVVRVLHGSRNAGKVFEAELDEAQ